MGDADADRLRSLIDDAFDALDDPAISTAALLRKAKRIAALRLDYVAELRFTSEMTDLSAQAGLSASSLTASRANLARLVGDDEALRLHDQVIKQFTASRTLPNSKGMVGLSIEQIEERIDSLRRAHHDATPPDNLTPIDSYFAAEKSRSTKVDILLSIQGYSTLLSRTKSFVHDYLVRAEREISMGQNRSDIFQRAQTLINTELSDLAPTALEQFLSAQDRLSDGSTESLTHALTSCRRFLSSLADVLYPPTSEKVVGIDGVKREMTADKYKNRLTEYVRQSVEGKAHQEAAVRAVNEIYSRLDSLDTLSSKGVHSTVTLAEAETCIVWTYMLAADLLRIKNGARPASES